MSSESVQARLDAATPGPWAAEGGESGDARVYDGFSPRSPMASVFGRANADLIAHAPADLAAALKVIEAAKLEHLHTATYVTPGSDTVWDYDGPCICGEKDCDTLKAIDAFEALP